MHGIRAINEPKCRVLVPFTCHEQFSRMAAISRLIQWHIAQCAWRVSSTRVPAIETVYMHVRHMNAEADVAVYL